MLPNLLFGCSLVVLAGTMFLWHGRSRWADEQGDVDKAQVAFSRLQYARRVRVCLLMAVVGMAIIGGIFMVHPVLAACYWLCVVAIVLWIGLLAIADLLGSRQRLRELREEHAIEHERLRGEIAKYKAEQAKERRPTGGFPI